jgi:hypothetical protein
MMDCANVAVFFISEICLLLFLDTFFSDQANASIASGSGCFDRTNTNFPTQSLVTLDSDDEYD